jgi:hypothetical protein
LRKFENFCENFQIDEFFPHLTKVKWGKETKNLSSSFTIRIAIESPCRVALSGPKMQKKELKCHKVDFLKLIKILKKV